MFAITIRERSGQVYTFHFDKPEVLIGRVKGNDVILPKQNISKRHTLVRTHGKRFIIEDLGSTNGTYVNGHRINTAVEIGTDDKVYLGDFVMNFTDLSDVAGMGAEPPAVPDIPDVPGAQSAESGMNARSTQHMANSPASPQPEHVPAPTVPPVAPPRDPLVSEMPPVEPLDMPSELMEQAPLTDDEVDYLDRLTGPVDAMHGAVGSASGSPSGASALASIPGLAGALKAPARPQSADFDADGGARTHFDGAPAGMDAAMGVGRDAPRPVSADFDADGGAKTEFEQVRGMMPPAPEMPRPAPNPRPASAPHRLDTVDDRSEGYHDRLGGMFRMAMEELRSSLPTDTGQMSDTDWADLEDRVTAFVERAAQEGQVQAGDDIQRICRDLIYELTGFGPLEPMLDDATIETIEVNAYNLLYVIRDGRRETSAERFSCQQALALAVDRLVRATGHNARSGAHLEGTLIDGTSLYVLWPPACPTGPAVVLRKPRSDAPELELLVARGTVHAHAAEVLARLLGQRRSVAIVGPAGVGKRTVLNALGLMLDPSMRVAVVEDGQRLRLRADQVIRVDASVFGEGSPSPLHVVQRLRPDVVLMGDASGLDLDELFSVGSDGLPPWLGVFSARSADDFVERATHALLMRCPGLSEAVAKARVLRSLDAVAVFVADAAGSFVLSEVHEVTRVKGKASLNELVPGASK